MAVGAVFNADGAFFQWDTHRDMLRQVSVFGILACGMTMVIITGGIDLSVGSILGVCAVVFSLLSVHMGQPDVVAIGITLLLGLACGVASGAVIARFRVQPFIATLAMMVFARGLAKLVSGGQKISTALQQSDGSYRYVDVPRIFEEGYRGSNVETEVGTGRGLYFVRNVIETHGGVVGYEPTDGGNNFYFILPMLAAPPGPLAAELTAPE